VYAAQIVAGGQAAVKAAGLNVTFEYLYTGSSSETELLSGLDTTAYQAVLAYPMGGEASIAELSRLQAKGLPVAVVGAPITKNDFAVGVFCSDQYKLGEAAGVQAKKYIDAKLKGKAGIAVLEHNAKNLTESTLRLNGFLDQIKDSKDVSLVSDMEAATPEEMAEQLAAYFKEKGDNAADIIYCTNADATVAAHNAIVKAGRKGKTAVLGVEADKAVTDILKSSDSTVEAVAAQDFWQMGYDAVSTLMDAVQNSSDSAGSTEVLEPVVLTQGDSAGLDEYIRKITEK